MTDPDLDTEYRNARSLVQDAMKRRDANALTVAVSIHNGVLDAIKRGIPDGTQKVTPEVLHVPPGLHAAPGQPTGVQ